MGKEVSENTKKTTDSSYVNYRFKTDTPNNMELVTIPNQNTYSIFKSVYKRRGFCAISMVNVQILTGYEKSLSGTL